MKLKTLEYSLRDDIHVALRSAESKDAEAFIKFLKNLSADTHFFELQPDEVNVDTKEMSNIITKYEQNPNALLMLIIHDGEIVGFSSIEPVSNAAKLKHRGMIKGGLLLHFLGYGIGRLSLNTTLKLAEKMEFEQYESELFSDNRRLIDMYSNMGFEEWGRVRRAYKIGGDYVDKLIMGKIIRNN